MVISFNGSLIASGPSGSHEEVVKLGIVGVDVISHHTLVQQFLIGLLFLRCICEGGSESVFELCPENLLCLGKVSQ